MISGHKVLKNICVKRTKHGRFQDYTHTVPRLLHTFCAQVGPRPPSDSFRGGGGGGGGGFSTPGGPLRSNFNPKNHHFSDDFPFSDDFLFLVNSYYVASLNDTY